MGANRRQRRFYTEDFGAMEIIIEEAVDNPDAPDDKALTDLHLPAKAEVCYRCNGKGVHDHEAFSNGITSDDWAQWDYDERDAYQRGDYDVTCTVCDGRRVTLIPDPERCSQSGLATFSEWERSYEQGRAEAEAERRVGA
jgi:hypothetical protein